jgi:hypothetical protein
MAIINISNVINVSVLAPPAGLAPYSINNIVCFTEEVPLVAIPNGYLAYASPRDVAADWGTAGAVYDAAVSVFSQSPSIITGGGLFIVVPMLVAETLDAAILRAEGLCYFGGCSYTMTGLTSAEILDAAATAEAERKLLFIVSSDSADLLGPDGLFFKVKDQSLHHARCLYYGVSASAEKMKWSYISRGMSTAFSAANTTSTMNLKQLLGVGSDSTLTQTILLEASAVGADVYPSIAGRPSVLSYGANQFFDDVYNLDWFVGALQVSGFNYLARTATKVPQTEAGMDGLKGAYRNVCQQSVSNAFIAAGAWTSPDTFGNPEDFIRNVADFGYFIYSSPVATQLPADRELRKAPVVQIAIKYAGAIHSSDVLVYINQ